MFLNVVVCRLSTFIRHTYGWLSGGGLSNKKGSGLHSHKIVQGGTSHTYVLEHL